MIDDDPVERGLALARARRWFDAHEAFEDAWRAEEEPGARALLRALVHACVSLEHRRRGNAIGAGMQLTKARARVDGADATLPLTPVARAWIAAVEALEPGAPEDRWPTP